MTSKPDCEIFSSRMVNAPPATVYQAFANPSHLQEWWGPEGFTNPIHEFDLQPGGKWRLTMHGPEKGNYENESVFKTVEPNKLIAWTKISKPLVDMEVGFQKHSDTQTEISFRMIIETPEECNKLKGFAATKNEENCYILEEELLKKV